MSLDAAICAVTCEFNGREFAAIVGTKDVKLPTALQLRLRLDCLDPQEAGLNQHLGTALVQLAHADDVVDRISLCGSWLVFVVLSRAIASRTASWHV